MISFEPQTTPDDFAILPILVVSFHRCEDKACGTLHVALVVGWGHWSLAIGFNC